MVSPAEIGATVVGTLALIVVGQLISQRLRRRRYPPGPPALPIIGNVHQLPAQRQEFKFHEWSGTYGEIFATPFHYMTLTIYLDNLEATLCICSSFRHRP